MFTVSVEKIIEHFSLLNLTPEINVKDIEVTHTDVNRPALQLAGFFDYFDNERIQAIGKVEYSYLSEMSNDARQQVMEKMFSFKIPCLVFCRGLEPFSEIVECAKKYNVPVMVTEESTSEFIAEGVRWLKVELAPRITIHGVLVDIGGEGILITGESGVGKSEMALELVKRGHRLVADDAVEIKKVSQQTLIGTCPELIRYFIELRGIGIIDVREMFGVASVKQTQTIDLIIKLEMWDNKKEYDRLGLNEEYTEILGNKIPSHAIPVRPGRNLAVICESAAINYRQKKMGYNAAETLQNRVNQNIEKDM